MTVRAVRSRSCAVDGWLTVSAGRRAADVAGQCREPLPVVGDRVPRWDEYLAAAAAGSYDAHPGTLAEGVTASGACGRRRARCGHRRRRAQRGRDDLRHHVARVVQLPGRPRRRGHAPRVRGGAHGRSRAARRAGHAGDGGDAGADVIVAGVGDGVSAVRPRAVVASGPSYGRGLLSSASTRQPGLVQLQDLTATALTQVGASDAEVTGRPLTVSASTGSAAAVLADRVGFETRAATRGRGPGGHPVAGRGLCTVGAGRRRCCGGGVARWRRCAGSRCRRGCGSGSGGGHGAGVHVRRQPGALVAVGGARRHVPRGRGGRGRAAQCRVLVGPSG